MEDSRGQSTDKFVSQAYWEERLREMHDIRGTGHRQFSVAYNEAMYRVATARLQSALADAGVDLAGKRVLDIGSGFGYFVRQYLNWGASHVTGVDITRVSVEELRRAFPQHEFIEADISAPSVSIPAEYDVVCAINVIFHIVDDDKFKRALENMCVRVKPGGHLILVDSFRDPLMFSTRHVHLRNLHYYETVLRDFVFQVRLIRPMYYLMGQSFVPVIGPRLLSWPPMLNFLEKLEDRLGHIYQRDWYFLKILIAERGQAKQ